MDVDHTGQQVIVGGVQGDVLLFDMRRGDAPLQRCTRGGANITKVMASPRYARDLPALSASQGCAHQLSLPPPFMFIIRHRRDLYAWAAATNEGQLLLWPAEGSDLQTLDLTGPELDAITGLAMAGESTLMTACVDRTIRHYDLALATQ